ncbi:MFS transporter [Rhodosalinus sp.]|uniref:MFS transporter n=1 Tax=Rhodosalinus sp. TaxID=2047741 RepID=UPI00397BA340
MSFVKADDARPASPASAPEWIRFVSLFVAIAIAFLGNGLQGTVVSVRAELAGMTPVEIGAMASAFFSGYLLGSIFAPRLIAAVGHIRTFAAIASIASAIALGFALVVDPVVWIGLRLAAGAAFAGLLIVVESWLNAATSTAMRARTLAAYNIVVLASWGASQWLLPLAPLDGDFLLFALISILFSFALVPVALARADGPASAAATRTSVVRMVSVSPSAFLGLFLLGMAVSALWGLGPSWAAANGYAASTISALMSSILVMALLLQWPLGLVSDRVDRRLIVGGAFVAAACSALVLTLSPAPSPGLAMAAVAVLGGAAMPCYAVLVAQANDRIGPDEVVPMSSALILVYGSGSAVGPLLLSPFYAAFGGAGLFGGLAACLACAALLLLVRIAARRADPAERTDYVTVPQTSHAMLPLHTGSDAGDATRDT